MADASGLYPVGTTTIIWTVTDGCTNTSICSMTVTVTDNEAPVITCPADIITCSTSQAILGAATATDNCGDVTLTNNAPSTFGTGTTLVVWTATDIHRNTSACTQTVIVSPAVNADAGDDKPVCSGMPFTFTQATATNYSSVSWTHNGKGTLSDAALLNATYTPAASETGKVEFKLTAYGTSGCGNMNNFAMVTLTIYPALIADAGDDKTIISGTATNLNGTALGGSGVLSYNWTPEEFIVTNDSLTPNTVPLIAETVFTLTITDALSGCSQRDNVTIGVDGTLRPIARNDYDTTNLNESTIVHIIENDTDVIGLGLDISIISNPEHGAIQILEDGFLNYTPDQDFTGNDTITYMICDRGTPSKCSTAQVIITIFPIRSAADIEIYNLVTPDGDGKNDFWYIGGIESFPDNEVLIFNRWGTKVKEFSGYNNSNKRWNGTNYIEKLLPDGVYYYIIKVNALQETFTGWVYIRGNH